MCFSFIVSYIIPCVFIHGFAALIKKLQTKGQSNGLLLHSASKPLTASVHI